MMSKYILVFSFVFIAALTVVSSLSADVPSRMSFQGKLYDDAGNPLNGTYEVTFSIYDTTEGGMVLWTETNSVLCDDGLYGVILGLNNPINLPFNSNYWLGIQISGDAEELSPRYQLVTAPYSFRAMYADSAGNKPFGAHDHGGETWSDNSESTGLTLKDYSVGLRTVGADTAIVVHSQTSPAIVAVQGEIPGQGKEFKPSLKSGASPDSVDTAGIESHAGEGTAIRGRAIGGSGITGSSVHGVGVEGTGATGVRGQTDSENGSGVEGFSWLGNGVLGQSSSGTGVIGFSGDGIGIEGSSILNTGIRGASNVGSGIEGHSRDGAGVRGSSENGNAGEFDGDVQINGNLNINDGKITTDNQGELYAEVCT